MTPRSRRVSVVRRSLLALAMLSGLAALSIGSVSADTLTVAAVNYRFEPETRSATVGDVVRWTFAGDPHTVTWGAAGAPTVGPVPGSRTRATHTR